MIRKIGVLLLVLMMSGCQIKNQSENLFLVGQAQGKNGEIKVEAYIREGSLEHIEILNHSETPGFDKAMVDIIDQVVFRQTLDVDLVTGATESSQGVLDAIKDALRGYENLLDKNKPLATTDKTADILIVGGGGAGFAAAIEAASLGFKKIQVIEKMPFGGGNTRMSGGEFAVAQNELQQAQGIQDSNELFFNDVYEGGGCLGKKELIQLIVDHAKENYLWLKDFIHVEYKDTLSWYGGHSVARTLWPKGDGSLMIDLMIQKALSMGVEVDYNTRAYELIEENGEVIGVKAQYNNETINYYGQYGVVLATGGFGANVKMRMQYDSQWGGLDESIPTTNSPAATGDGIVMAEKVGANLLHMQYIQLYPINNPATGNYYYMDYARIISNAILVNEEGNRFVDEKETRDNIAKAILSQTNSTAYELVALNVIEELKLDQDYADELYRGIDQGVIVMGTLEECANHFNISYSQLEKTLSRFNQMAEDGKDLDFGRTQMLHKMEDDQYMMFSSIVSVHHTMGGVEINEKAEVLNMNGNPIKGLYAAGEVTGGIHGNNRLGTLSIPDMITFGRIAAQSCFQEMKK